MSIEKQFFGTMPDGRSVFRYILKNKAGMSVSVLEFGGTLQSILVPDREGRLGDVVCGFDTLEQYLTDTSHHGALIGRFANRIANARFSLDGKEYPLAANNGKNHLHGGPGGFDRRLWQATPVEGDDPMLRLFYSSPDGEEGYPGRLDVTVTYTLYADNRLSIDYRATADRKTVVNLTNHAYFNIGGYASGRIYEQELWLDADAYLPTDAGLIPLGERSPVAGTPFDFTVAKPVGRDLFADHPQIAVMNGYDTCFCFVGGESDTPRLRAVLYDPKSGREMRMLITAPAAQVYTANGMQKPTPFKGGVAQEKHTAICLEAGGMPDSINQPQLASPLIDVGEVYRQVTEYAFSVR